LSELGQKRYKQVTYRSILYGVLIIAALYYLVPLLLMILTSFRSTEELRMGQLLEWPDKFSLEGWSQAWNQAQIGARTEKGLQSYFINSIQIVIPAVTISTVIGALNGYLLSLWRFRGSELFFSLLLFGCFLPFQAIIIPMSVTLGKLGVSTSMVGLILVHVVYGIPFTTLFFRNYYVGISVELIKAAKLDGAGFWLIFTRIVLPLSTPIIIVSVIWQFTMIWNDFLFGVIFGDANSQPITVGLNNLANVSDGGVKRYNVEMAGAIISALPTILVYIFAGKYFVRGLSPGAVKG